MKRMSAFPLCAVLGGVVHDLLAERLELLARERLGEEVGEVLEALDVLDLDLSGLDELPNFELLAQDVLCLKLGELDGDYRFAREQGCDLRLFDFESFGGFGKEVRSTLREAANQLSNKLSHAQHLDEVTWTTKNWHGLQMQRLSVVLHTAVAWQTVNELACGESGIVHGAECIAVLNGVA